MQVQVRHQCVLNDGDEKVEDLGSFLEKWDRSYEREINKIPLFNMEKTLRYSSEQKESFARSFYHIRGGFYKFLWLLGNHAPNKQAKKEVLYNIDEEFGGDSVSHEQLYFEFTKGLGLDISDEFLTEKSNFPFIKDFNFKHLEWLSKNGWSGQWAAFSAYERLDNIDYKNLLMLAKKFGVADDCLGFFIVHNNADHFDRAFPRLMDVWNCSRKDVENAFHFIKTNQIKMWENLSQLIMLH
jgi:hypothetical protein